MSEHSKLINTGSSGCIFYPRIPCEKEKVKKNKLKNKKGNHLVTKVIIREEMHDKEYEINNIIKKTPNHRNWTVLWDKKCKSPPYSKMITFPEINKCLSSIKTNQDFFPKQQFTMLQGTYGGTNIHSYINGINSEMFTNEKNFTEFFLRLFRDLGSLFLGIVELDKKKICHNDITSRNIVFDGEKFLLIDYGLSRKYNDKQFFIKRMKIIDITHIWRRINKQK